MSRTLILIAAPSLVVTSLALSAAQQLPNVTPGMVEMTEPPTPAAAGFNNRTNGFAEQAQFDRDRKAFEEVETILPERRSSEDPPSISENSEAGGGLGPVYNATSCVSCHQNPITGSSSQVSEIRAGHRDPNTGNFIEPPGGSLIHQRAIRAEIQEHVRPEDNVRTLRMSTNTLGNGFVEVIQDRTIIDICDAQPRDMQGLPIIVPVAVAVKTVADGEPDEFEFVLRIGRFGWKAQEASLLNFSANAYLNEMGITSPLQPNENRSNGRDVSQFDEVADPEDEAQPKPNLSTPKPTKPDDFLHPFGEDVEAFARFMRSTKVPPRDFALTELDPLKDVVKAGEKIFTDIKCAVCHTPQYITPPAGTPIRPIWRRNNSVPGIDFGSDDKKGVVPEALGNKILQPFSDFMLHDIGTGDGIVQTQQAQRPARGAQKFLQQQAPEIQRLQQSPAEAGRCVMHIVQDLSAQPTSTTAENVERIKASGARVLDQRTANMIRTAPLWGLRVRPQLLHDGSALTIEEAILRHSVQAKDAKEAFERLSREDKQKLLIFLRSL
jgi:CxxC motif-containing protein (DUF1111 family)